MRKYLFIIMAALLMTGCVTYEDGEPVKDEAYEKRQEEKQAKEVESQEAEKAKEDETEEDNSMDDDELNEIKTSIEEQMENDRELGDEYYLEKVEHEDDTLSLTIDLQQDPLPSADDVKDYSESIAWYVGDTIVDDLKVHVTTTTKLDDDEFILYGFATYKDGDTSFKEKDGMQLLK